MKFAHFSHVWNKPDMSAAARYDQLWKELELCDQLGFDYGFAVEHHFSPHESWMPSPPVYCTAGGMRTKNIRLGPMGYIVPVYNPIRIVEEAAVLDNVLHGRLELGLVSGITPDYFVHYKADYTNKRALANEAISLMKAAFTTEGRFDFNGPYHQYEQVNLSVKPLQKPYPPMWMQSRDPQTLELLAKEGVHTGYLIAMPRQEVAPRYQKYLDLWKAAGHQEKPNIGYWTLVYVDETDQKAEEVAAPHIVHAFGTVFGFGDVGGINQWELAEVYEKRGEHGAAEIARHMTDVEYLLEKNLVFVGTAETVTKRIRDAAAEGMFNTVMCEFNIGSISEEQLLNSIRLFGENVIPALRSYEPY